MTIEVTDVERKRLEDEENRRLSRRGKSGREGREFREKLFCSEKHELATVFFRFGGRMGKIGRIVGYFYCVTCQKFYEPTLREVKSHA